MRDVREYEKEAFPALTHIKCLVCSIPVQKKSLRKKRQVPVCYEKNNDCDHRENNFRVATSTKTVHFNGGLKKLTDINAI